jgi:hypothetical protein
MRNEAIDAINGGAYALCIAAALRPPWARAPANG